MNQSQDIPPYPSGLKDVCFHDLRQSFATRLVQRGDDLYSVKELLDHRTITMTMRYAHHDTEIMRQKVEIPDGGDTEAKMIKGLQRVTP